MRRTIVLLFFLAVTLPAWAHNSADHWFEVRSPHFVVMTDSSEKQARRLAGQFERMRAVFHVLIPSASDGAGSPITVLALKDRKAFQTLEPEAYLAKGQLDLAGLFLQAADKNYILLRLDAQGEHPFAVVYHEYTHFMLRGASEWMPLWLNEGLAEFYQNSEIQEKEVVLGKASADDILYLRQNRLIPLKVLLKVDHNSPYYHEEQKGSVFYSESWALTHFIEVTDKQKNTTHMIDYVRRLAQKEDSLTAAQETLGDLNQLQKALSSYIGQGQFMEFKLKATTGIDESTFEAKELSTSDADAVRADVMVYNQRTKDAQTLIEATLQDDPKCALAHESMGYLKFREGDVAAARKWYGEAVELDSKSYLAHYYYATMSMQSGETAGNTQIESSLHASIKLNPAFAPAYDALASYYSTIADKPDEAHKLNLQAIGLDPANLNYRLNASSVLMNAHKLEDALAVLKAAKPVAKTPEEAAMLQSRMDQIGQFKATEQQTLEAQKTAASSSVSSPGGAGGNVIVTDTRAYTVTSSDGRQYTIKANAKDQGPKYPTEMPSGPHLIAKGVLQGVQCFFPTIVTFTLKPFGKEAVLTLYRNNFNEVEFSASNFTPKGDLNPCTDIEGLKAKVTYAEVSDKSIAGQVLSIELSR